MRSHDARMAEELDNFRIQMGKGQNLSNIKISNLIIDLPSYVEKDFRLDLNSKIIEASSETWFFWYGLLNKFISENGHSDIKTSEFFEGYYLGKWVSHQRKYYKSNNLSQERMDLLNEIDGWSWDPRNDGFNKFFNTLEEFLDKYGEMPTRGKPYKGVDLMDNILSINFQRKKGKYNLERLAKLESLSPKGFGWSKDEITFEKNFFDLLNFSKREKHSYPDVLHIESDGGVQLGRFANNIRKSYHGSKSRHTTSLDKEKIKRFETEIPYWNWSREKDYKFEKFVNELEEFLKDKLFIELKQNTDLGRKQSRYWLKKPSKEREIILKEIKDFLGINVWGLKKSNGAIKLDIVKFKKILKKKNLSKLEENYLKELIPYLKKLDSSYLDEIIQVIKKKLRK